MANPQKENGYTAISNEIMEALIKIRIPGEAMQVLFCIIRKTYGFHKLEDTIPLSQFAKYTGINKPCIVRALKKLQLMNLIVIKKDNKFNTRYCFQKNYDRWKPLSKKITHVIKKDTLKRNSLKRTKGDKFFYEMMPEKLKNITGFSDIWNDWINFRIKKRKPVTSMAAEKQFNLLLNQPDPIECIDSSIRNDYQGLFPVKSNFKPQPELERGNPHNY